MSSSKSKKLKYRVLFVDDEPRVTSALKAIFRREYDVAIANSGQEALDLLSETKFDVLVSDQRMPGMLGHELLAIVAKKYPHTMRILLTGFMDKQAIVDSLNDGEIYRFINKPWHNDEMREVVAEAALASELPVPSFDAAKTTDKRIADNSGSSTANTHSAMLMMEHASDVRTQIRRFCTDHSIMVYGTQNIQQAVAAATSRDNIGVAVIELSKDIKASLQTIHLLKLARPEVITIALTEEYDTNTAVNLINQGQVFKYLAKPLDINGFQQTIEKAFHRHHFLKRHKKSRQRYRVEKPKGNLIAGLQDMFKRLRHGEDTQDKRHHH